MCQFDPFRLCLSTPLSSRPGKLETDGTQPEVSHLMSMVLIPKHYCMTGAEATIITEDLNYRTKTKLQPSGKPALVVNNMPLDAVAETVLTLQLGGIKVQRKVLLCRGFPQVLIGIEFLMAHKCIREGPSEMVFGHHQIWLLICCGLI